MKKRIGIMGGTFDPIHIGHLLLAETAYEQFGLEQVWFMPAGNPPHKQNRKGCATDEQRTAMVKMAIDDNPHFTLSLLEMNEDGYSYTYRTLERLNKENPDKEFYFIIGADSLFDFEGWREPQRICKSCRLIVATRNHTPIEKLERKIVELEQKFHGSFLKLDSQNIDIASNTLRSWIAQKRTIRYYTPKAVEDYIYEHKIYEGCE